MQRFITSSFRIVLQACLILVPLFFVIISFTDHTSGVELNVSKLNSSADTIQRFPEASILSAGKLLYIPNPTHSTRLLAAGGELGLLHSLLFLLASVIIVTFFWDFNYKNPFTKKALTGLRISFWVLLLFLVINFWQQYWFEDEVRKLTQNEYIFHSALIWSSPEIWIFVILIRLTWIFKKGVALQKEMDLTV